MSFLFPDNDIELVGHYSLYGNANLIGHKFRCKKCCHTWSNDSLSMSRQWIWCPVCFAEGTMKKMIKAYRIKIQEGEVSEG